MSQNRCRAFRFLALFWVVLLLLAGCVAPIAPAPATSAGADSTASTANLAGFPLTIENCGRTLTFTKPPERVLTTWQTPPELLVKLGLGDRIIGTENALQFPPPAEIAEAYAKVPVLAEQTAAKEAVIAAKPDFIIASFLAWDFDPNAGRPSLAELAALGVPVFGLSDNCTAESHVTAADMYNDMLLIGRIFGVAERAQALVDIYYASIRYADGIEKLARAFHPDAFEE